VAEDAECKLARMGSQSIPHFDIAVFGAFALAVLLTGIVVLLSVVVRYHRSDEKELKEIKRLARALGSLVVQETGKIRALMDR